MIMIELNLIVTLTNAQNVAKIQQRSYVFMSIFIWSHSSYTECKHSRLPSDRLPRSFGRSIRRGMRCGGVRGLLQISDRLRSQNADWLSYQSEHGLSPAFRYLGLTAQTEVTRKKGASGGGGAGVREGVGELDYLIACNRLSYSTITMQGYTVAQNAWCRW